MPLLHLVMYFGCAVPLTRILVLQADLLTLYDLEVSANAEGRTRPTNLAVVDEWRHAVTSLEVCSGLQELQSLHKLQVIRRLLAGLRAWRWVCHAGSWRPRWGSGHPKVGASPRLGRRAGYS